MLTSLENYRYKFKGLNHVVLPQIQRYKFQSLNLLSPQIQRYQFKVFSRLSPQIYVLTVQVECLQSFVPST